MNGKIWYKILSVVASVSLLLNSLWGIFLYPQTVFAEEATESAELELIEEVVPTPEPSPTPLSTPDSDESEPIELSETLVEELEESPVVEESASLVVSLWNENEDGSVITSSTVGEGVEYRYKDTQTKVLFTKLTEPGYLTIREFEPENAEELGILGKAYEITSDMQDETFEYDLTLPLSEEAGDDFSVKYAENPEELSSAQSVNEPTEFVDDTITIKGLTHFTVFVVVPNFPPPPESFLEIIIDNTDPEFSILSGSWRDSTWSPVWYGSNYKTTDERVGTEQVEWRFQVNEGGSHEVYAWWTAAPNRGTGVPYTVNYEGNFDTVFVDQEQSGGQWNLLGAYDFDVGADYSVVLTNNATDSNDYVIADAIKIKSTEAPSEVWVDDDWISNSIGDDLVGGKYFGHNAFATIQDGIDAVNSGGTVNVAAGIYTNDIWNSLLGGAPESYRITKSVVLLGAQAGNDPAGSTNRGGETILVRTNGVPYSLYASDITIDGFTFTSGGGSGGGRLIISGDDVVVRNSIIKDISGIDPHGIWIASGAINALIEYSTFSNTAWEAIRSDGNVVISNNTIKDIPTNKGIYLGVSGSAQIINNIISNTHFEGIQVAAPAVIQGNDISGCYKGIQVWDFAAGTIIEGNNIYDNTYEGIQAFVPVTIQDNEISGGHHGIQIRDHTVGSIIDGNNIHDNTYHGLEIPNYAGSEFVTGVNITNNTFTNNGYTGVKVGGGTEGSGILVNYNNIYGNGYFGVESSTTISNVDAIYNDWGVAGCPAIENEIGGSVDYLPYIYEGITYFSCTPVSGTLNLTPDISNTASDPALRPEIHAIGIVNNLYPGAVLKRAIWNTDSNEWVRNWEAVMVNSDGSFDQILPISSCQRNDDSICPTDVYGRPFPAGNYKTIFQAYDTSVVVGVVGTEYFTIDNTLPETGDPLNSPEDNSFWNTSILIQGTSTDNILVDLVNLFQRVAGTSDWLPIPSSLSNLGNDSIFSWFFDWAPSTEGLYDIMAAAVDTAGNEEESTYVYNVTFDITPPSIPILTWPINGEFTNNNAPLMQWNNSNDGGGSGIAGYYYRVYYSCSNPDNIPDSCSGLYPSGEGLWRTNFEYQAGGTSDGIYYWQVRAKDNADNLSNWSELEKVIIDTEAPAMPTGLKFLSANGNTEYQCGDIIQRQVNIPVWDEYAEGDFDHYEYSSFHPSGAQGLNEKVLHEAKLTNKWMPPADGAYGFSVRTVDKAGNKSPWSLSAETLAGSCQIIYDTVVPEVTINNPLITNDNTPELTGTYSDTNDVVLIEVSVGGQTHSATINGDGTWTLPNDTLSVLADDLYDVVVEATDEADNIGTDTTVDELRIDTVAPTATFIHYIDGNEFTGPIAYVNNLSRLTFTGNYSDPIPSSNLKQDSFVIFDAQADGSFRFSANDAKAYCSWRSGANTMPISGINDTLLNVPFTNCTNSLMEGEYYMTHQVYDNAIRKDIPSITQFRDVLGLHFIIDKTDPELSWTSPAENAVISGTTLVSSNATDVTSDIKSVAYYYQKVGESTWNPINSPLTSPPYETTWNTTGLELGDYNLKAVATDNAGNDAEVIRHVGVAAIISSESWERLDWGEITISWTTDRQTNGRVVYDTVSHSIDPNHPNYGYAHTSGTVDTAPKTLSHTITLSGLLDGATYYWRTVSGGSPIVISAERRGDTFSIPGGDTGGEGVVAGVTTSATTTPFPYAELEDTSTPEEETEEVLGEETEVSTEEPETPLDEAVGILSRTTKGRILAISAFLLGLILYFISRRRRY